jgi:hypothetical protein
LFEKKIVKEGIFVFSKGWFWKGIFALEDNGIAENVGIAFS